MKTKALVFLLSVVYLVSCEGSRSKRMYDAGKSAYDNYEKTGDPTGLVLFVVGLLVMGGIWLWKTSKDK